MKLFERGLVGKLSIKNRIVMAPMGILRFIAPDSGLSQRGIDYYAARAKGGVGLIITGGVVVNPELEAGDRRVRVDGISNDGAWLVKLADTVHRYGAKIAVQLGVEYERLGRTRSLGTSKLVGPSSVPCFWDHDVMTREITIYEIKQLVESFKRPAEIIRLAGIDAVELHAHAGSFFDMFMTKLWNKRSDRYGGDLDGRLRLPLEVIQAIKAGAGRDFPVIYRFGLTHYLAGGREIDEGLEVARRLEAAGIDALDVDAGCYETHHIVYPSTYSPPGPLVHLAEMVKRVVRIPVMVVGKLGYPEIAERVLQEGKADFIILGKTLLADPEWANKVKEKRPEDICPCIGDFVCVERGKARKIEETQHIPCTVNPIIGRERGRPIRPSKHRKSVVVVGGGPGGMEAARVAALRGHRVTLLERGYALGGNLIPASVPDFKQDYRRLIDYLATQLQKLGVTVDLGKEATPELIRAMKPDAVFVATGSTPLLPQILGADKSNVLTAPDLFSGKRNIGAPVAVLGGGLVGCETALFLAKSGKKVTVVEARDDLCTGVNWAIRTHLLELLVEAGVNKLTSTRVQEITGNGIIIVNEAGDRSALPADTVVIAIGFEPNRELYEAIKDSAPLVRAIGDCVEPREVKSAMWEAFEAARLI